MKRAYLVLGPESSGTPKVLIDAGCFGDGEHDQRLDKKQDQSREILDETALPEDDTPVVWRRSYPHGGKIVDISKAVRQLQSKGYEVFAVVTTRDWYPMIQSQLKDRQHANSEMEALQNVRDAYRNIFQYLPPTIPYFMASYDSIGRYRRKALRRLLELLQLTKPRLVNNSIDGNAKWYNE
jgi:hypothetical protein